MRKLGSELQKEVLLAEFPLPDTIGKEEPLFTGHLHWYFRAGPRKQVVLVCQGRVPLLGLCSKLQGGHVRGLPVEQSSRCIPQIALVNASVAFSTLPSRPNNI